jgi:hypothetical protein
MYRGITGLLDFVNRSGFKMNRKHVSETEFVAVLMWEMGVISYIRSLRVDEFKCF